MEKYEPQEKTIEEEFLSSPLETVLYYLSYDEILSSCRTSTAFSQYCQDDRFWKRYANFVYGVYKRHFVSWKKTVKHISNSLNLLSHDHSIKMDAIALIYNLLSSNKRTVRFRFSSGGKTVLRTELYHIITTLVESEMPVDVAHVFSEVGDISKKKGYQIGQTIPSVPKIDYDNFDNFLVEAEKYILVPTRYYIDGKIRTINFDVDRWYEIAHEIEDKFGPNPSAEEEEKRKELFALLNSIGDKYEKDIDIAY